MMPIDPYLLRCLDLARLSGSLAEPNPRVGALVLHEGKIAGEGYHRKCGGPHAEVNAVNSVRDPSLLPHSTLYVSLEPCNHHGLTPPCTDLILRHRIPRVVIGSLDPNPQMAGRSVEFLRGQGVEVTLNANDAPFKALNAHFWVNQAEKRPFVTLKWAQSRDGFIAAHDENGMPRTAAISSKSSSRFVHYLRAQHQAILVGINTAQIDNPSLTTRKWQGPDPVRIVFDPESVMEPSAKLWGPGRVIVLNQSREERLDDISYRNVRNMPLKSILEMLYREERIGSILVEGGAITHRNFLKAELWDECWQNIGAMELGKGVAAPAAPDGYPSFLADTFTVEGDGWRHFLRNEG